MFSYLDTFTSVYLLVLCAALGLVMGSALNCLAYRIVHEEKWTGGRSHCPGSACADGYLPHTLYGACLSGA